MFFLLVRILTLLVSTGNVVCLWQIPIITLNLKEMQSAPPCVFITQCIETASSSVMLGLIFSNFSDRGFVLSKQQHRRVRPAWLYYMKTVACFGLRDRHQKILSTLSVITVNCPPILHPVELINYIYSYSKNESYPTPGCQSVQMLVY
jgi:hypothetical protein